MANLLQLLPLQPFSPSQIGRNHNEVPIETDDQLQLATDVINVEEGRTSISTFPAEYQDKIRFFYQFSATRIFTEEPKIAKRTTDTLDIV